MRLAIVTRVLSLGIISILFCTNNCDANNLLLNKRNQLIWPFNHLFQLSKKTDNQLEQRVSNSDGQPRKLNSSFARESFIKDLLHLAGHEQDLTGCRPDPGIGSSVGQINVNTDPSFSPSPNVTDCYLEKQLLKTLADESVDSGVNFDWIKGINSIASWGGSLSQIIVNKLGAINCPALISPSKDESRLTPRFYLFNELRHADIGFELPLEPNASHCLNGLFDQNRKTILLIHGFLAGYNMVDGLTNIKNRLLDLNSVLTREIQLLPHEFSDSRMILANQQYNVIEVDWYNGANPVHRASYIRSAVDTQIVARFIARHLMALIGNCGISADRIQLMAHSLGCHVAGFTGKEMRARGHTLARITHLDPVGLCFGRLFSKPKYRLNPDDATETEAVHVSLNIFDNPLDGVHSNFLVNGGRDQYGCGGLAEVQNSTVASMNLLFDPYGQFAPCSHMHALNIFGDDQQSSPNQCQMVGYRCPSYDDFLAGRCASCESPGQDCALMSFDPVARLTVADEEKSRLAVQSPLVSANFSQRARVAPLRLKHFAKQNVSEQFFLGTSVMSPYCINYYQFRMLVEESELRKLLTAPLPATGSFRGPSPEAPGAWRNNFLMANARLVDTSGRFFKGFTVQEDIYRMLTKNRQFSGSRLIQQESFPPSNNSIPRQDGAEYSSTPIQLIELTMLLNTTSPVPIKVSECKLTNNYHDLVVAHRIEINYMSNILPEVRAAYSSVLCPIVAPSRELSIQERRGRVSRYSQCIDKS